MANLIASNVTGNTATFTLHDYNIYATREPNGKIVYRAEELEYSDEVNDWVVLVELNDAQTRQLLRDHKITGLHS